MSAQKQADDLLLAMQAVLNQMIEMLDYNQMVERLRNMIKQQERDHRSRPKQRQDRSYPRVVGEIDMAVLRQFVAVVCFGGLIAVFSAAAVRRRASAGRRASGDKAAAKAAPASPEKLVHRPATRRRVLQAAGRVAAAHERSRARATDPRRAALLKKAVEESKKREMDLQFNGTVDLLQKDQLSRALENQARNPARPARPAATAAKRGRGETPRIGEETHSRIPQAVNELIKQQQDVQGRTSGGGDMKQALRRAEGHRRQDRQARRRHEGRRAAQGGRTRPTKARKRGKGKGKADAKGDGKGEGKGEAKGEGKGPGQRRGQGRG